jgi:hypothetical protein
MNIEKYLNQMNTLFGDLSNLISTGFNLPPPPSKDGAMSYNAMNDRINDLNKLNVGLGKSESKGTLSITIDVNQKNQDGLLSSNQKMIDKAIDINDLNNYTKNIKYSLDMKGNA